MPALIKTFQFKTHTHAVESAAGTSAALNVNLAHIPEVTPQVFVDGVHLLIDGAGDNGFTWESGSQLVVIANSGTYYEVQYNYDPDE